MKKTKIICTMGPTTDKEGLLSEMLKAGMDMARLIFLTAIIVNRQKGLLWYARPQKKWENRLLLLRILKVRKCG